MERWNELHGASNSKQNLKPLLQLDVFFFGQHGTGHGFGAFLSVHEGPHGFSSNIPLAPGHVITNEPGFCKFCSSEKSINWFFYSF